MTALKLTTSGCSAMYAVISLITPRRRASEAPAGRLIWICTKPWSSLGRKDVGKRKNSTAVTPHSNR